MKLKFLLLIILAPLFFTSCKKSDSTSSGSSDDSSSGGLVAGSIGGALASSDTNGTVAFNNEVNEYSKSLMSVVVQPAMAASACPKVTTTAGSGCTQAGSSADLTYASCGFGSSAATYSGILEVSLSASGTVTCGTFPNTATLANNQSIQRQMVASAGVAGTATRTSGSGSVVTIDHASANLSNFDTGTTITANIGAGYGSQVVFDGTGKRKQVIVRQRLFNTDFDHSIDGTVGVSETGTTRTLTGSVKIFHNKLKVLGTSSLNSVVYNNTSCAPISGTIVTVFTAGAHVSPTVIGSALVGKSESLAFNADGTAVLTDINGGTSTVTIGHCY